MSKEIMEMRNQEKLYFSLKNYDKAEYFRQQGDYLEK
jgi:hypothetical protein